MMTAIENNNTSMDVDPCLGFGLLIYLNFDYCFVFYFENLILMSEFLLIFVVLFKISRIKAEICRKNMQFYGSSYKTRVHCTSALLCMNES